MLPFLSVLEEDILYAWTEHVRQSMLRGCEKVPEAGGFTEVNRPLF